MKLLIIIKEDTGRHSEPLDVVRGTPEHCAAYMIAKYGTAAVLLGMAAHQFLRLTVSDEKAAIREFLHEQLRG